MTLEYGVIYSTHGSEKKTAYRALSEFFAAHPGFPTTRALRTQTVKGMNIGEVRNITKTLGDGSKHNFRFIARESTHEIPDSMDIERIALLIAGNPENTTYGAYFAFPGGNEVRSYMIARKNQNSEGGKKKIKVVDIARELVMGCRDFNLPLVVDRQIEERIQLLLPKNATVNVVYPGLENMLSITAKGLANKPDFALYNRNFNQPNGDILRTYLTRLVGKKFKHERNRVAMALLSGQKTFSVLATYMEGLMPMVKPEPKAEVGKPIIEEVKPEPENIILKPEMVTPEPAVVELTAEERLAKEQAAKKEWLALIRNSNSLHNRSAENESLRQDVEAMDRRKRVEAISQLPVVKMHIPAELIEVFKDFLDERLRQNPHMPKPPVDEFLAMRQDKTETHLQAAPAPSETTIPAKPPVTVPKRLPILTAADIELVGKNKQVTTTQRDPRIQKQFRTFVFRNFGDRCAITGKKLNGHLHAAHIEDAIHGCYNASNGILMSPTFHTLFDRKQMGINPETMTVHFAPGIEWEEYECKVINPLVWALDKERLAVRWQEFIKFHEVTNDKFT
ncbi:HNH endonuclease [Enterobacter ludwigii]|nr:HNH endonuclease [Enterobacter ludwigii]